MAYAENTTVSQERSREQIGRMLSDHRSTSFAYACDSDKQAIMFTMNGRQIRFVVPVPTEDSCARDGRGSLRTPTRRKEAHEQVIRQRWRALFLVIKAKLEAIETGITIFDDEFLAHIVMSNGQCAGEWMAPQLEKMYEDGRMPPMLPFLDEPKLKRLPCNQT